MSAGTSPFNRAPARTVFVADLFCGGGGFTAGLFRAADLLELGVSLVAINHDRDAIKTHSANHQDVVHFCESVDTIPPRKAVPGGKLDLLLASPPCTHFSTARGGRPMSDQSRSTTWRILEWLEMLDVSTAIIENVPVFRTWGPLYPCECGAEEQALAENPKAELEKVKHPKGTRCYRPIEKQKGLYFRNFIRNLKCLGYRVDWRILNSADYGAAQERDRFFLVARKGRKPIHWPEPTHAPRKSLDEQKQGDLAFCGDRKPWRGAREIIDWSLIGESIYGRKKALAPNTMARIYAGLRKFSGLPFLLPHQHGSSGLGNVRSLEDPAPTITGTSNDMFLARPFLVVLRGTEARQCESSARSLDEPAPTLCGSTHLYLADPFLIQLDHNGNGHHGNGHHNHAHRCNLTNDPLRTVPGKGMLGRIEPFVIGQQSCSAPRMVDDPIPTVAAAGAISLVEPYLVAYRNGEGHERRTYSTEQPLPTQDTSNWFGLAAPYLIPVNHGPDLRGRDLGQPLPTLTGKGTQALIEPWLVEFHGERPGQAPRCQSLEEPLGVVAASPTHGLCRPYLVRYNGTGDAESVDEPLPTVTTRDRFALVHPEIVENGEIDGQVIGYLDIRFRMLAPHELAAAMSFPPGYVFHGTREKKVRQIGNAVVVDVAEALCRVALGGAA